MAFQVDILTERDRWCPVPTHGARFATVGGSALPLSRRSTDRYRPTCGIAERGSRTCVAFSFTRGKRCRTIPSSSRGNDNGKRPQGTKEAKERKAEGSSGGSVTKRRGAREADKGKITRLIVVPVGL